MTFNKDKFIKFIESQGLIKFKPDKTIKVYYGLPYMDDSEWIVCLSNKDCFITNKVNLIDDVIVTSDVRNISEYKNYKYHIKSLVRKANKLIKLDKENKLERKLKEIEDEFS